MTTRVGIDGYKELLTEAKAALQTGTDAGLTEYQMKNYVSEELFGRIAALVLDIRTTAESWETAKKQAEATISALPAFDKKVLLTSKQRSKQRAKKSLLLLTLVLRRIQLQITQSLKN